jgi:hypothetical protein
MPLPKRPQGVQLETNRAPGNKDNAAAAGDLFENTRVAGNKCNVAALDPVHAERETFDASKATFEVHVEIEARLTYFYRITYE